MEIKICTDCFNTMDKETLNEIFAETEKELATAQEPVHYSGCQNCNISILAIRRTSITTDSK